MSKAYLSLGSNIGNKKEYLDKAIDLLEQNEKVKIIKKSSYYETKPVGYTNQDMFLNMVIQIQTELTPFELLKLCGTIEQLLKRERLIRWGPRTIDLDILLFEATEINEERLTIPHPRMKERGFVMIPLYEIEPHLIINGQPIKDIITKLEKEEIRKTND